MKAFFILKLSLKGVDLCWRPVNDDKSLIIYPKSLKNEEKRPFVPLFNFFAVLKKRNHKLKSGTSVVFRRLCRFWIYFFALWQMCHISIFQDGSWFCLMIKCRCLSRKFSKVLLDEVWRSPRIHWQRITKLMDEWVLVSRKLGRPTQSDRNYAVDPVPVIHSSNRLIVCIFSWKLKP